MLNLKDILSITGKPGLYRIVAQTAKGVIVETLDEKRTKMPVQNNYQVAMLEEITIFTDGEEELGLKKVLENIENKDGMTASVTAKDDPAKIKAYFMEVAPGYDTDRVYVSDMKKILKWYEVLSLYAREDAPAETTVPETESTETELK